MKQKIWFNGLMKKVYDLGQKGKSINAESLLLSKNKEISKHLKKNPLDESLYKWILLRISAHKGDYSEALRLGYELVIKFPKLSEANKARAWLCVLWSRLEDFEMAKFYAQESLKNKKHFSDTMEEGMIYSHLLTISVEQNNIEEARTFSRTCINFGKKNNIKEIIYWGYLLLAKIDSNARELLSKAEKYEEELDPSTLIHAYRVKAEVFIVLGMENKAKSLLKKSIKLSKKANNHFGLGKAYEKFSNISENKKKDFSKALEAYDKKKLLSLTSPFLVRLYNESKSLGVLFHKKSLGKK